MESPGLGPGRNLHRADGTQWGTFDHQLLRPKVTSLRLSATGGWNPPWSRQSAQVPQPRKHGKLQRCTERLHPPNLAATQSHRSKYGFGLNVEQELTPSLGVMGRLGWNDGRTETWMFTEIDRSASCGLVLKGNAWQRPQDQLGVGTALNGLSPDHEFPRRRGYGFILGDGKIQYARNGSSRVLLDTSLWRVLDFPRFTWIDRPADNRLEAQSRLAPSVPTSNSDPLHRKPRSTETAGRKTVHTQTGNPPPRFPRRETATAHRGQR